MSGPGEDPAAAAAAFDSPDHVHAAVKSLYGVARGDKQQQSHEDASKWLAEFQKSLHAWSVSDRLLHEKRDLESCYFAAHTMRAKILSSFHELPADSYGSLRDSLLQHLLSCPPPSEDVHQVIQRQLALAIVDLALQIPAWSTVITDLKNALAAPAPHAFLSVLLFFPEEVQSTTLRLGAAVRSTMISNMCRQLPEIFAFLELAAQQASTSPGIESVLVEVFRCLSAWLQIRALPGMSDPSCSNGLGGINGAGHVPITTPLIPRAFELAGDPGCSSQLHEAVTDCLSRAIIILPTMVHTDPELARFVYEKVHGLANSFHSFVGSEDLDKVLNTGRLFIELGEALVDAIVSTPGKGYGDLVTMDRILDVIGYHDFSLADMSFSWWYRFSESLYVMNSDVVNEMFRPHVSRLVIVLYRHVCLDADFTGIPDDSEDSKEFRAHVKECIRDVAFIPGSKPIFRQMFEHLKCLGAAATWVETEAALFIMSCVAKNLIPSEDEVVPEVMSAVLALNQTAEAHVAVKHAALLLLCELDEWIAEHPDYVAAVMDFEVGLATRVPPLAAMASRALDGLCSMAGADHLGSPELQALSELLMQPHLGQDAALCILRAISSILSKMPVEQATQHLRQLCLLQVQPLVPLISKPLDGADVDGDGASGSTAPNDENVAPKGSTESDANMWLDRLAIIFRQFQTVTANNNNNAGAAGTRPIMPVIEEIWPILSAAASRYVGQERTMERCCRCIRYAVRCAGKAMHRLLESLVTQIMTLYRAHPHSCLIYLGSILVDEFGEDPALAKGLLIMADTLQDVAFRLVEGSAGFDYQPNTLDDLFRLGLRFIEKAPEEFFAWDRMPRFVQTGIYAVHVQHRDANESVCKFLVAVINYGASRGGKGSSADAGAPEIRVGRDVAQKLVDAHGSVMVHSLLKASIFVLPETVVRFPAEVLTALLEYNRGLFARWLDPAVAQINSDANLVTPEHITLFRETITTARDYKTVYHSLRDFVHLHA